MHSHLEEILKEKKKEIDLLKTLGVSMDKSHDILPVRDFKGAISLPKRVGLIAEIKFASPSAGVIREKDNPLIISQIYEATGAAAISLLTDKKFFRGEKIERDE